MLSYLQQAVSYCFLQLQSHSPQEVPLLHHLFTPLEIMLRMLWQMVAIRCLEENGIIENNAKHLAFPQVLDA